MFRFSHTRIASKFNIIDFFYLNLITLLMNYEIFLNKIIYFNKKSKQCQIYDLNYLLYLDDGQYNFKTMNGDLYQIIKDKLIKIPIFYQTEYYDDDKGHSPIFICKSENYFVGQKTNIDDDLLKIEVKDHQFVVASNGVLHKVGQMNYDNNKFTLNGVYDLFKQYKYLDRLIKFK